MPAYGRQLLALREAGKRPAQPVYVTDCWPIAHEFRARERFALMCEQPTLPFNFQMLRDLDVVIAPVCGGDYPRLMPQIRAARPKSFRFVGSYMGEEFAHYVERVIAAAEVARGRERSVL